MFIQRFVQQHLPKLGVDRTLSGIPAVVIHALPVPEPGADDNGLFGVRAVDAQTRRSVVTFSLPPRVALNQ